MAISVQKCKEILKKPDLTDEQVEEIRDALYQTAHILVQSFLSHNLPETDKQGDNIIVSNNTNSTKRGSKR